MTGWLLPLALLAAFVVVVEGCNKAERTDVRGAGNYPLQLLEVARGVGWVVMVLACIAMLITPFANWTPLTIRECGLVGGMALLFLRDRLRELITHKPQPDLFHRTVVFHAPLSSEAEVRASLLASMAMNGDKPRARREIGERTMP